MGKYFGSFDDLRSVIESFGVTEAPPTDDEIVFASYGTRSYEGYAIVVFRREGKLFEANGSHCSCFGLEGQWSPEETTEAALGIRALDEYEHGGEAVAEFRRLFPAPGDRS